MIYAYIRVSTEMQNYSSQEFEIDNYCRLHNLKIDKWYSEAISGTKPIEKKNTWQDNPKNEQGRSSYLYRNLKAWKKYAYDNVNFEPVCRERHQDSNH